MVSDCVCVRLQQNKPHSVKSHETGRLLLLAVLKATCQVDPQLTLKKSIHPVLVFAFV